MSNRKVVNLQPNASKTLRSPDEIQAAYEQLFSELLFLGRDYAADHSDRVRALSEARRVVDSIANKEPHDDKVDQTNNVLLELLGKKGA
jgi:hypothetical protein